MTHNNYHLGERGEGQKAGVAFQNIEPLLPLLKLRSEKSIINIIIGKLVTAVARLQIYYSFISRVFSFIIFSC